MTHAGAATGEVMTGIEVLHYTDYCILCCDGLRKERKGLIYETIL